MKVTISGVKEGYIWCEVYMCSLCTYALCGVHIGIPTPGLCGIWHGHPYIHPCTFFGKCFLYLIVCVFLFILKVMFLELLSDSSKQMITELVRKL